MRKGKVGLQKEISKIFTGIQIPKKDASEVAQRPVVTPSAHPASPAPAPTHTSAPAPVHKSAPVLAPAASPAPAQRIAPKPVAQTPHLFTIQEPPSYTESALKPSVYEAPVTEHQVYEPPAINQNVYEPPRIPTQTVADTRIDVTPKQQWLASFLKVINNVKGKLLAPKHGVVQGRQKLMILLIPVLSIVFIVVLFKVLRSPSVKPPVTPSKASASAAVSDGKITWELPPLYPDSLRDPMILGAVSTQTNENAGRPPVKGIVFSEDRPIAVVGDRIVSVGETVQGATVVKINPDSVEFSKGDQKWTQEVER